MTKCLETHPACQESVCVCAMVKRTQVASLCRGFRCSKNMHNPLWGTSLTASLSYSLPAVGRKVIEKPTPVPIKSSHDHYLRDEKLLR